MNHMPPNEIRTEVLKAYSEAAKSPTEKHPFPVGRTFAESVGYPAELLNALPPEAADAFAGVSNVSITASIAEGNRVLDLGCGAGLDSLLASRRTGPCGEVVGIDFSDSMLNLARSAADKNGTSNIRFIHAGAEELPVPSGWADVVLVNGIFNLNPARSAIFKELARVTRKGGNVFAAELILSAPLPPEEKTKPSNWFA
jgi:arsenite methyltransferase